MTNEPGSPDPHATGPDGPGSNVRVPGLHASNAEIDAYFTALLGDSFPELTDADERRQLAGVSRALTRTFELGLGDQRPRASLQSSVLAAVRSEAARSQPVSSGATAPASTSATLAPSSTDGVAAAPSRQPFGSTLKRFRGRIAVVLVALVAAITALFSSFGSSPVVAATAVLAPVPGSPAPQASGSADFISPEKGAKINKVAMKVTGLTPTTDETEYQCWLVGPGDSPTSPNRILVGTFSTADGTADFGWKAKDYSPDFAQLDISLEQKDGNPDFGGVTVLSTKKYNGKRTG